MLDSSDPQKLQRLVIGSCRITHIEMHGLQAKAYRTFDVAPLIVHKHGLPVGA